MEEYTHSFQCQSVSLTPVRGRRVMTPVMQLVLSHFLITHFLLVCANHVKKSATCLFICYWISVRSAFHWIWACTDILLLCCCPVFLRQLTPTTQTCIGRKTNIPWESQSRLCFSDWVIQTSQSVGYKTAESLTSCLLFVLLLKTHRAPPA